MQLGMPSSSWPPLRVLVRRCESRRLEHPMKRASKCRNRRVRCPECGCTAWQSRSWMAVGLLGCSCGGRLEPTDVADKVYIGLLGPEDMSQAQWNAIARELDLPIVLNQGQAAQAAKRGRQAESVFRAVKPQCSYPGCGRWTADGAEYCREHDHSAVLEAATPF